MSYQRCQPWLMHCSDVQRPEGSNESGCGCEETTVRQDEKIYKHVVLPNSILGLSSARLPLHIEVSFFVIS